MTFDDAVTLVAGMEWFDLALLVQMTGQRRQSLTNQLHRWARTGKVVRLRRGMYTLADRYRRTSVNPAALANQLYAPSYLTAEWALSFYGLIPEQAVTYTSATTRTPREFSNPFGRFVYRHVKRSFFFGSRPVDLNGRRVVLAKPEKALLDQWHLSPGEWTAGRMASMRYRPSECVNQERLRAFALRFGKPRLLRAVEAWAACTQEEQEGSIEL